MRKTRLPIIATAFVALLVGSAPGVVAQDAAAEPVTPAMFTADIGWADSCEQGTRVPDLEVDRETGWRCGPQTWTATDPRFSGSAGNTWDHDVYRLDDGTYSVTVGYQTIHNEAGGWTCRYEQLETGVGLQSRPIDGGYIATCTGGGGYDGLSALLSFESGQGQSGVKGLIFEGEMPPGPEVAGAE